MISAEPDHDMNSVSAAKLPGSRLDQVFKARAAAFPDCIAVSDGLHSMTYAGLDAASDKLARSLRRLGIGPGSLVGLYMGRSVRAITGMLGILKAGGAYLPLDPDYTSERTRFILDDSKVEVLLSESSAAAALHGCNCRILLMEDALAAEETDPAIGDSVTRSGHAQAYVIYTSGSTGKPKGVVISHHNVIRLFEQTHPWFGFDAEDVWCQFHSIGFDFSVWEIWGALLYGGRVLVVPHAISRSPDGFRDWVAEHGITILNQTPSAFRNFDEADRVASKPLALRHVIFGGEALVPNSLEAWVTRHGDRSPSLVNMFGITETTVHVTYKVMRREDIVGRTDSPIGRPISDLTVYLLDEHGNQVPNGQPGEMHIAGPGVALGYLHRPDLSSERFIEIQPAMPNGVPVRAYKSGDVAVRSPDGELFYRGRCDDQIKVRGYRIEPREIEAVLLRDEHVAACCVLPYDYGEGDVRLVAYVTPAQAGGAAGWADARTDELRRLAASELPGYMRPSAHVILDTLPMTPHGKIDKRALPAPESGARARAVQDAAATGREENFVLSVWRDQIGLRSIDLHDDFFDHGGTSLALIRSLSVLKKHYGIEIEMGGLANGATAANLAGIIRANIGQTH